MRCLKALFVSLQLGLGSLGCLYTSPILAQITSDGTVNTLVNQNGNVAEITGGETRESNLFHSFQDFSVQTGNEAFFNNADSISNILSRVTGGNISNIDGLIRANGSASLFLINPAGIIFGENASLDIGGSFYSSSASSILFEDGEFSAVDNLQQPLLTINAPIGLSFRDNPEEIVNRSRVENSSGVLTGLEISSGNNLAFVGGDIRFESGNATARGGNIYLGGLAEAGIVNLNQDGSLSFPQDPTLADITLTNGARVDVRGAGGGNIRVDGNNLSLAAGELGRSVILGGIAADSTSEEAQAGDVTINVAENITLNDSAIGNQVAGGIGNSGNITITTDSLELIDGGFVDASTLGQGDAGAVNVTATGDITADGFDSGGFPSGITSLVDTGATGDSGGVTITTTNLNLTNGGRVDASTLGQGDAGAVNVTAEGDITADGEQSGGFPSGITSGVAEGATGNSGGVTITTTNLNLTNGGRVAASTLGQGDAGAVDVTATGDITVDGEDLGGSNSGITSQASSDATGDSGGVTISTTNLNLTNGGQVAADTLGQGNAAAVNVTATGNITADGEGSRGFASGITSLVNPDAVGNAGGITISTANLNLTNGGRVDASTFGQGNAGAVNITATGDLTADGEDSAGFPSLIDSRVEPDATGDAGGITISTANLNLTNGGRVATDTSGQGNAGAVTVTATGDLTADGENSGGFPSGITSLVNTGATGDAGGITISTTNLDLNAGGRVNASTLGQGNAGAVTVTATGDLTADGENSAGFPSGVA
ncbi:MAG: filamentous hemagglutinin N-terminal domain-containing protein, partial [Pleurocapsa sp. MO_226.B13]|nr:filamentous hemagglutinin N-terminal domain-containing protein [Pleurocapsa sp. MO_226.B13]